MIAKTVEIRDVATFVPALAIRLHTGWSKRDRWLLARAGFGETSAQQGEYVILLRLSDGKSDATYDPHLWPNRTMRVAHAWLIEHFDEIDSGAVVDVEFILGKTGAPKLSEASEGMWGE